MKLARFAVVVCLFAVSSNLPAQQKSSAPPKSPAAEKTVAAPEGSTSESGGASASLPVRKVVLYKNGVGYFEHLGRVRNSQDVHIDFTSAQLNDVLKSLTVLDLSGGRITGVDYNSEAPLTRRLATLRLALGERPTQAEFLGALRGARIEVTGLTGPSITGRLLSVERKTRSSTTFAVETDEISLITDSGQVRSVDLSPATSVRIVDHDLQTEVGKYLGLVASAREQDVRRMTISTTGVGERNLYVSYISEVPIWKTTYRIVLSDKQGKKPLLQGWAIVDNTVGEDWNNVELSLVAGAPHSFVQQLSEPYYGRRPVVSLPESVQLSPQTHSATLSGGTGRLLGTVTDQSGAALAAATVKLFDQEGGVVAETVSDSAGNYSFSSLPPGSYKVQMNQRGFKTTEISAANLGPGDNQINGQLQVGTSTQIVMVEAAATSLNSSASEISSNKIMSLPIANRAHLATPGVAEGGGLLGKAAALNGRNFTDMVELSRGLAGPAASGQDLGDLFEYKLKDRVTLKKNQSALVPIAQTDIEAEKVSIWSGQTGSGRPLRGIWMKNTSSLTFDGGSFNVLENEVFAGEGLMDPIKPGERRLLSYATDLGLLVEAQRSAQPQHVTRVKIAKGTMTMTSELRQTTLYTVKSQEDTPRTLVVEHTVDPGTYLSKGTKEPAERAPGTYRFEMEVAPRATASLPVEEVKPLQTQYQLTNIEDTQIAVFVQNGTITGEMAGALRKISAQKALVSQLEEEMENRQKDIDRIVADQERLRENMKALKGSAEEKALLQRYTRELDQQETRLDDLRKNIQDTEAKRDKAQQELETLVDNLEMEATL